ncbi:MAG: MATE family efflux transporter [Oscillospiraceae bacterium]|nr:MATE family efflux transporter [Oscillospiraceae bacterium]
MNIQLSEHFTYRKLLRFTLPSIVMMVFSSIYGVVDGIFVSNFAGKQAFAAINLIMPYIMLFGTLGIMVGTGGTALVSMTMGTGDSKRANQIFSQLIYATALGGIVLTIIGIALLRPAAILMGAQGDTIGLCVTYGLYVLPATPALLLQFAFQSFCAAAEKPNLGLGLTVAAGVANIILDALFVGVFRWGLIGAAVATALSQCIGGIVPLIYFARENPSPLRLTRAKIEGPILLRTCTNGSSELMSNLSMSVVGVLYNRQLMAYAGEDGVAAYGVIMYVTFIFIAVFLGYSIGAAPVIGYHYGAGNREELKSLFRKSLVIIGIMALVLTAAAEALAAPLSAVFVGYDRGLYEMTKWAFMVYSLSFLVCGFSIYGSSHFTALNNGLISAVISFLRTLVFQSAAVMLLPIFFGLDGIWFAIVAAELISMILTIFCFVKFRKRYHYA